MDVVDTFRILANDGEVIATAVRDVTGVQAQLDGGRVGALEEAPHMFLGRHVAVGVRMECQYQAELVADDPP